MLKLFFIFVLLVILYTLGSALFHMARGKNDDPKRMVRALTWRIGLSVALFAMVVLAAYMGWIEPHPIDFF
ncbi:MAG: twin transmembrane helix small protein [Pseudomonadota bacterium]